MRDEPNATETTSTTTERKSPQEPPSVPPGVILSGIESIMMCGVRVYCRANGVSRNQQYHVSSHTGTSGLTYVSPVKICASRRLKSPINPSIDSSSQTIATITKRILCVHHQVLSMRLFVRNLKKRENYRLDMLS